MITPEYNPTASRADYWIPVRPETDGANFLGTCKIIIDENMQDIDYIKEFTDMPILVRTDTLAVSRSARRDRGLCNFPDFSKSYSGTVQSLKPEQIERLGGMMVWDLNKKQAGSVCTASRSASISRRAASMPALTGTYRVKLLNGREVDVILDLPNVSGAPAGL